MDAARTLVLLLLGAIAQASCDSIDDDLSDCGKDVRIEYTVRLLTNMQTELDTELTTPPELLVADGLRQALSGYFSDRAHDLDLSFFSTKGLAHHESHIIDAREAAYTLYLPVKDYRHLGVANTTAGQNLTTSGSDELAAYTISQLTADSIDSHSSGLFTARANINIDDQSVKDQTFHVWLYMQNSAAALVLDPGTNQFRSIRACIAGTASSFLVNDSTYAFDHSRPVRMTTLDSDGSGLHCLYGKCFPSPDMPGTRAGMTTDKDNACWQLHVYVTLLDGTVTESRLYIPTRLPAGELRIVKGFLQADGTVVPSQQEVGVSVQLDWKPGGTYEPEL
ncbi:MAG: hypothetical protein K6D37_07570 [Prevotella sp.]|nr:hypothetical protein [Prevotella sp.]